MPMLDSIRVRDYMATQLVTFTADTEVMSAAHQLVRTGHSGAPVVDTDGRLIGMLSEKDCLSIALVAAQDTCVAGPVSQYMSRDVQTVDPDLSIMQLASLFMKNTHFRRYPVVADGKLVGQISRTDVLRAISDVCG
ncbi:MAG TPA: CBS domain-containing protein [Solimonas sp.]